MTSSIMPFLNAFARAFRTKPRDTAPVRSAFDLFGKVLESNNKALETIADMGDKLGGGYLFDAIYLRDAYGRLREDVRHSMAIFRDLTHNRYPQLDDSYERIDGLIARVLDDKPSLSDECVIPLDSISWGSGQGAGGKMGPIAEVRNRLRMEVPDGFVVTTAAYDEYMKFNGLGDDIRRLANAPSREQARVYLRGAILHGAMPPAVSNNIARALLKLLEKHPSASLALRSSADEEDGNCSFAGQFASLLGVSPEPLAVELAYRQVLASLFSDKAAAYAAQKEIPLAKLKMAVGCMVMVDAVASGVAYSTIPGEHDRGRMMISSAWGLGESVVEARTGTDEFVLRKAEQPELVQATVREKKTMLAARERCEPVEIDVADERRNMPSLDAGQLGALGKKVMDIERHFGNPRDIEWAVDRNGVIWFLQARRLNISFPETHPPQVVASGQAAIIDGLGVIVQHGVGAGTVFIPKKPSDIFDMPKGAVLVASHDSSLFVQSMPSLAAIITEQGSAVSHMAALSRELQVPTIVNVPRATHILKHGQEVTVIADADRLAVYDGIIPEALGSTGRDFSRMEAVYEYRRKRYILRYISTLHLIDPLMNDFMPERCRTLHDILRFMHEKAVAELVDTAREAGRSFKKRNGVVPLDLPVPAGIMVMDLGGGLVDAGPVKTVGQDTVASVPFRAILRGMLRPGAWHADPVRLKARDFLSSMIRMPDLATAHDSTAGYNVAVISANYVNMSIRFGYHFNMLDAFCSGNAKNNHLYFRFAGGATDLVKRSRRLELISRILGSLGMSVKMKGDLLIGRISGLPHAQMEELLEKTGTLIAYARQLDAVLHDDRDVDRYEWQFLKGNYGLR
ncbi:MAG TPA: PEP/pyruvate-binding domain-containing protein [Nitrospirota bacterium]|nr:PEP/pyruvate-binding domain-containing protein [Nitrospirota bacterium]